MVSCEDCIHNDVCDYKSPERYATIQDMKNDCAHCIPTADVVPKSEVEELIYKLECLLCHATGGMLSKHTYDLQTMESVVTDYVNDSYEDGYAEAKQEVAREIFEEIDRAIKNYGICFSCAPIAELKKKYTED